jgi:hypothetical protein
VDRRFPWTWNASLGRVVPMPTWRVLVSMYNPGVAMLYYMGMKKEVGGVIEAN